jgi:branched-chain amino acid transport system substrate-binding protein
MKQLSTALLLFIVSLLPHSLLAEDLPLVKIGLIFPLTGSMSSFGEDVAQALPLLEKKFNTSQSKYNFQLLLEDGKFGQTNATITAAKKLVEIDGVHFLVSGSSGETLQIASYAENAKVLTVAGFASHPDLRNAGDYIFRTYVDVERGIEDISSDLHTKGITRLALITEETSFTAAVRTAVQKYVGNKIVISEYVALGDTDFKSLVAKARGQKPQAYYLNIAAPASFITLFKQLRENGVTEPFYTYYLPSVKEVQQTLGPDLNGTTYLDFPETPEASEDFTEFLADYQKQAEIKAPFNFKTNYNAIKVIYDGIVAVGPDSTKVKDFLYQYDQPSATGRLRFDSNGDARDLELVLRVVK